ncbi:hypothetical protein MMC07_001109 [Pseudocyphellaria aurata]|nr:hypothetical protein [Pseudocyphellaria aurata]
MVTKIFLLPQHLSSIDSGLRFAFRILLPLLFFTVLLIAGTVMISYTFYQHKKLPEQFTLGISLTLGILLIVTGVLLLFFRVRRFNQRRWLSNNDEEAGRSSHDLKPVPSNESHLALNGGSTDRQEEPETGTEELGSDKPIGLGIRFSDPAVSDDSWGFENINLDGAVSPSPPDPARVRPRSRSPVPGSYSPPPSKDHPIFHEPDPFPPVLFPPKCRRVPRTPPRSIYKEDPDWIR